MISRKLLSLIIVGVIIITIICLIITARSCNNYGAGSGLGSIVDIENEMYKGKYLKMYSDTFLYISPRYKVPQDDPSTDMTSGYEFLDMTKFYFDKPPREIYCVQWEGTGFVSIRFVYNIDKRQGFIKKTIGTDKNEKERISMRFRMEILDKIDSIIAKSSDRDLAILKANH